MIRQASVVLKTRLNLTRFHGLFAPNSPLPHRATAGPGTGDLRNETKTPANALLLLEKRSGKDRCPLISVILQTPELLIDYLITIYQFGNHTSKQYLFL